MIISICLSLNFFRFIQKNAKKRVQLLPITVIKELKYKSREMTRLLQ